MSDTAQWAGVTFNVYRHAGEWNDVGGVYIFCGLNSSGQWVPIYIGQTDSFRNRIPRHEQWIPAVQLGATHVHALVVQQAAEQEQLERLLIATFRPPLNTQLKQSYFGRA